MFHVKKNDMATKPRYKTKSNNYKTQKDYARLKKLLDDGAYVVCFVDYEPHSMDNYTFQQIALAYKGDQLYEISAHGISYLTWYEGLEFSFEDLCECNNVEFIEPTNTNINETVFIKSPFVADINETLRQFHKDDGLFWKDNKLILEK